MRAVTSVCAVVAALLNLADAQSSFVANVLNYGAVGDGKTMNTAAIESAIAAVAAHQGGQLWFPSGTYLTAPLNLTSNLVLNLTNATLLASGDFNDWAVINYLPSYGRGRDFPGPRYEPFLGSFNLSNVRITGSGAGTAFINGQGAPWWASIRNGSLKITPGHLFECLWSDHIEIDSVTFVDSPFWNIHLWSSSYAWVHDVAVLAPHDSTNTDGVDPDSSSHVLVENVYINNGDDCIAVKSGLCSAGVRYGVPSTNITIRNMQCQTQSACIAIGSEMSGGIDGVLATNISCITAGQALNVKSALGRGGYVRNINFTSSVLGPGVIGTAFAAADNYKDQYPPEPVNATLVPIINGIYVSDITVVAGAAGNIGRVGDFQGLGTQPEQGEVTGVVLRNIDLTGAQKGWDCVNVTGTSSYVVPTPCSQLGG